MTKEQFEQLTTEGHDLNILYLLSLTSKDLKAFTSSKVRAWIQTCVRKQLLSDNLEVTISGKQLLDSYTGESQKSIHETQNEIDDAFERWWEIYPPTDYFSYKGKDFPGTQAKKVYKTKACKPLFKKIVNEGKYTAEDILRATEFHITTAKEQSIKENKNCLSFIPNSERYLRIQSFAPFVELSKKKFAKPQSNMFEI